MRPPSSELGGAAGSDDTRNAAKQMTLNRHASDPSPDDSMQKTAGLPE